VKNIGEMMEALLAGKKLTRASYPKGHYIQLIDGVTVDMEGTEMAPNYHNPEFYSIYGEPMPKVIYYRRKWVKLTDCNRIMITPYWASKEAFDSYWDDNEKSEEWEEIQI
jgi:hypothetical protein